MLINILSCANGYTVEAIYQNPGEKEWQFDKMVFVKAPDKKVEIDIALQIQRIIEKYELELVKFKATE